MFTGIVDHLARLEEVKPQGTGLLLRLKTRFSQFTPGESLAIDGTCLTVVDFGSDWFDVQLSVETLDTTIARSYQVGGLCNLERALRVGDALGGHFVSGHVDGTANVTRVGVDGDYREIAFEAPCDLMMEKGSVTLNGVSLTVNTVDRVAQQFTVMLIPHTLERTNLKMLKAGDRVNVEFDLFYKMVRDQLSHWKGTVC
ncbi:MAG: riboflavin synthase [Deltaproteobacteria bacterium]|nr:riboflavin synthase [Deltaproteobacteria bacterium]MBI3294456.1 riboflavin synthase [Deltaproteobacteria bacterium]